MQLNAVSQALSLYPNSAQWLQSTPQAVTPAHVQAEPTPKEVFGQDTLLQIGRMAGHATGGGIASYKYGAQVGNQYKAIYQSLKSGGGFQGTMGSLKDLGLMGARSAGISALVSAGSSALFNSINVVRGNVDVKTALGNVTSDTIGGAVGGLGGVALAGAGSLALSAMGMAGLPLTIGTVALGAAGSVLAGKLMEPNKNSN